VSHGYKRASMGATFGHNRPSRCTSQIASNRPICTRLPCLKPDATGLVDPIRGLQLRVALESSPLIQEVVKIINI